MVKSPVVSIRVLSEEAMMDVQTFFNGIAGEIDCSAIRKTGGYGAWWYDVYGNCSLILYAPSGDFNVGYSVGIVGLNNVNPPTDVSQIAFYKDGEKTDKIPASLGNEALAALPYVSGAATITIEITDTQGNSITEVNEGDPFQIRGTYKDASGNYTTGTTIYLFQCNDVSGTNPTLIAQTTTSAGAYIFELTAPDVTTDTVLYFMTSDRNPPA